VTRDSQVDDTLAIFWRQLSGARNHDTLSHHMMLAEKKTEMYSDFENFENDDVIAAVLAFRL